MPHVLPLQCQLRALRIATSKTHGHDFSRMFEVDDGRQKRCCLGCHGRLVLEVGPCGLLGKGVLELGVGIVAGGGVALIRTLPAIEALKLSIVDEQIGVDIVRRAIEAPLRELARNAGVEGGLIVQEVKRRKGNEGYNVATGEYEDLVKAGVVDPKKVTRSALQNAASIAGLLLTTEAVITDIPEKKEKPAGDPHHGGGGMDY